MKRQEVQQKKRRLIEHYLQQVVSNDIKSRYHLLHVDMRERLRRIHLCKVGQLSHSGPHLLSGGTKSPEWRERVS